MRLTSTDALVVWLSGVIEAMDPCNNDRAQGLVDGFKTVLEVIESAEPIEAEVVKHGRWNARDLAGISIAGHMVCSCCDVMIPKADNKRYCLHRLYYCPRCGAKMDLEEEPRQNTKFLSKAGALSKPTMQMKLLELVLKTFGVEYAEWKNLKAEEREE